MIRKQEELLLSTYIDLYDQVVPKTNLLRQMKELVDFSFIYEELKEKYAPRMGRAAIDPIRMFKYILLKTIYNLSDKDVVERSQYDLSFKYFLDMAPEAPVIEASSLTKFRKLRLQDMNVLDLLIQKTVEIALEKKVLKSTTIIVDATHTKARYNQQTPKAVLMNRSKRLRKAVYMVDETVKETFPKKPVSDELEDELAYSQSLIDVIEHNPTLMTLPSITAPLNYLKEAVSDDLERLELSKDEDARVGHKSKESAFFGYKSHLAMSDERLITAAVVTTGEKSDGKYLKTLIEKSKAAGMTVDTVIGDTAYSEKDNISYTKERNIELISKLNPIITQGFRKKEDEFAFNKDAGMFVCPAGHMAVRRAKQGSKNKGKNQTYTYYFDIEKCKVCPLRDGCYKDGAKSKSYSISIKSDLHLEQETFQNSPEFKEKAKERYKIEAKNSELKHRHGYDVATSSGLVGMELQGAVAIFTVNLKRILKLMG